jgi:hypothetical protein
VHVGKAHNDIELRLVLCSLLNVKSLESANRERVLEFLVPWMLLIPGRSLGWLIGREVGDLGQFDCGQRTELPIFE